LQAVRVDLLFETFGTRWPELREGALAAERAGYDGVWLNDHLAGSVEGARRVLECWTSLSALAAAVPRMAIGPLVLNDANRDPGTLAVMAATLQEVSGGRLLLGLGAGARAGTPYAIEQAALGRPVRHDPDRRGLVERTITVLRQVWTGAVPPATGFLRPEPVPPVVIAASGPKMAELAGRLADGVCVRVGSAMDGLIAVSRDAYALSGRDPEQMLVTATLRSWPGETPPPVGPGIDRLIVYLAPPFPESMARLAASVSRWRDA
jgi:alkanesulfonate monooxygenase SsuD/methylene tetrahydromethanopterin reductase-like flavin-dependent oxidoreductase (luciferase family)